MKEPQKVHQYTPLSVLYISSHHFYPASGKWELIDGVNSYITTPTINYPKDKVVLFLMDVFGLQLINNQLLADDFARNRFKVCLSPFSFSHVCVSMIIQ